MKKKADQTFTIGALAKRSGVAIETIRFYEREGVIEAASRRDSGYREYGEQAVAQLRFVRRAKDLGFTLKEITDLLKLRTETKRNCSGVKRRALEKIASVESKIRDLQKIRSRLIELTDACDELRPISTCPILRSFEREEPAA